MRTYEVEQPGTLPSGCSTPAGKAAASVAVQGDQHVLLVDDHSSTSHTVVTCPLDPRPATTFSFKTLPAALPNGFLVSLLTGTTLAYHLNITPDGAVHWYDGTHWTQLATANTVHVGAWNTFRLEATPQSAQLFVNEINLGTASRASAPTPNITAYQLASNGTVPTGDRIYFDDVTTTPGRTYDTEPLGATPSGCTTPAGKSAAVVSNVRAHSGTASLRLDDRATNTQEVVSCPVVPQRGIDLRLSTYPAEVQNGFLISLRGHFEGQPDPAVVFHLAFVTDGSIRWYDGLAWTTVTTPGAVPVGAWTDLRIRAAVDEESIEVLKDDTVIARAGPVGMRRVTDITGFDLSSNGTATAGDEVFFDDVQVDAAPEVLPPGAVGIGPAVTIQQEDGLLQMPHSSVSTGTEAMVTYAAHVDTAAGTGTRFATSANAGETWSVAAARNPMPDEQSYNLSRLRNGDLMALSYHTYMRAGDRSADVETKVSHDGGQTWGTLRVGAMTTPETMRPIDANSSRPGRSLGGFVLVHNVVEDADGTLYQSACGYYTNDTKYRQLILRSTDGGVNWTTLSTVAYNGTQPGEGFCEAAIARAADGSLLAVMRTGSYLNMYTARSTDNGRTWTTPSILRAGGLAVVGVYPNLIPLLDGRLALYYGRPGQSLMLSPDGSGTTWLPPTPIDYRNSANGSAIPLTPTTLLTFGDRGANWSPNKPPTSTIWSRTITLPTR
ncbi:sialidase family protein [Kribbella sp. NPDC026611]|uniref:sialidase family protein n=1 Tax=Kribbella sp. NPDC026611 TaxID=3154911 RepID=UPI0033E0E267